MARLLLGGLVTVLRVRGQGRGREGVPGYAIGALQARFDTCEAAIAMLRAELDWLDTMGTQ